MISLVQALPAGNAIRILLTPPAQAKRTRLLRRGDDVWSDQDDPDALLVLDAAGARSALDVQSVVNGQTYYYRAWHQVDGTWLATRSVPVTPGMDYADGNVDALMFLRERLDLGLREHLAAGRLQHPRGHIPVLTAPPIFEDSPMPLVTLHLTDESTRERGIGESIRRDAALAAPGLPESHEGWLASVRIAVIGWSLNPDERSSLRQCLRSVLLANLPVLDAAGLQQVDWSMQDVEDFGSFAVPVYQVVGSLSCIAPVSITTVGRPIADVQATMSGITPHATGHWPHPHDRVSDPYDASRKVQPLPQRWLPRRRS